MTEPIQFRLLSTEPTQNGVVVHWIAGISNEGKTAAARGEIEITDDVSGLSANEILALAITAHGGEPFVEHLIDGHKYGMLRSRELDLFDDWYAAYAFMCSKTGHPCEERADAHANLEQGFGSLGLNYNHSIFNLTTNEIWSHTFVYNIREEFDATVDPENEFGGTMYHIKVRGGVVVEWYKRSAALQHNGQQVAWVSLDLSTGDTLEYYKVAPGETNETSVMHKFDATTDALATATVHASPEDMVLPEEFRAALAASSAPSDIKVFGYAQKSYGMIVEYMIPPF